AIDALPRRSPVVEVLGVQDLGCELRTMLLFKTETLVQARDGAVQRKGPVAVGLRYNERFLSEAPNPSEIVSILEPFFVFHPNVSRTGALCLGHPQPGLPLEEILHMTWAALVFNLRMVDTTEWHG